MGKAHLFAIVDQLMGQFSIGNPAIVVLCLLPPTAKMDFVNTDRLVERRIGGSPIQPIRIIPLVFIQVDHDRRRVGRNLREKSKRIGLVDDRSVGVGNPILVMSVGTNFGNEQLPTPAIVERSHPVLAAVPSVEVTNNVDVAGVRCPNRKNDSAGRASLGKVCSQTIVNSIVGAFTKEVQVEIR